jgi:hypothetical protein
VSTYDPELLDSHFIDITVDSSGDGISIALSEEPIVVPPGNTKKLHWRIGGSAGWKLDTIVIANPGTEFEDDGGDDDNHKWKNKHTVVDNYKYSIKFKNGTVLDPTIKNQ